jgi:uncharacterized protein (TIGR02001 family)
LSFEAAAVSDYRYRGISLSGGEPALQVEALLKFDSGIWASVWSSTLSGDDVELQLGAGNATDILFGLNLEIWLNYYAYPSDGSANYAEAAAAISYQAGAFTPRLGIEYAPAQAHLRDSNSLKSDNLYVYVGLDLGVAGTPVTLSGQIGYERGVFDTRPGGGKWDWRVGARAETKWADFGLSYIDSNGRAASERGRNLADGTLVATLGKSF